MANPNQGAVGFQGPIGLPGVVDQSPEDGFPQPPTTATHPTAINVAKPPKTLLSAGTTAPTSAYTSGTPAPTTGFAGPVAGPLTPWHQEGITPPEGTAPTDPHFGVSQEQITAMQASQRAMTILRVAPSLKNHPDIVAALAYNTSVPFTPETISLIAAVQKARSAIDYSAKFTLQDYDQTLRIVNPEALAHESFIERISRGLDKEGNMFNNLFPWMRTVEGAVSWEASGLASNASTAASKVSEIGKQATADRTVSLPQDLLDKGYSIQQLPNGTVDVVDKNGKQLDKETRNKLSGYPYYIPSYEGTDGEFLGAIPGDTSKYLIKVSPIVKGISNFVTSQFDTPEQLYRYIASVQSKYGTGMAALALLPTVAGALIGTALGGVGGAKGAELATVAEEALTNSFINDGLSELAAATLAKRDLSLLEERAAVLTAQRAAKVGDVAGQLGRVVTAPINALSKVATSPISLGADVGFTGGGQVLFRQEYMDSRDGTTWAEKNPMLASTFGRWATQNMDAGGWKTFLSGSLDAIAAIAVPDAIGSVGRVVGIARSAEGFTGGLLSGKYKDTGNWFGNIYDKYGGISRAAEGGFKIGGIYKTGLRLSNIDAAYNESASARRTVNMIAQMGSAGAIMAVDARFAPIADLLSKARVLNADGTVNMTKSVENVKQVLRDSQTATELMERPLAMTSIPITANGIYQDIGEAMSKANALTGHMFSPLPLYADTKTLRMENKTFTIGNRDALPAIRDMIGTQYGYGVADQVVNELAENLDPHFWQQTIVNGIGGEMAATVAKEIKKIKLPEPIATAILKEYDSIIPDKLREVFNFGGPSQQGAYGWAVHVGEKGVATKTDLSRVQERIRKVVDDAKAGGPVDVPEGLSNEEMLDISRKRVNIEYTKPGGEKGYAVGKPNRGGAVIPPSKTVVARKDYETMVAKAEKVTKEAEAKKAANKAKWQEQQDSPGPRGYYSVEDRLRNEFKAGKFEGRIDRNQFEAILGQIKDFAGHVGLGLFDDVKLETASFSYRDPLKAEGAWGQGKSIPGVAGSYNPVENAISLFADALFDPEQFLQTGIHEFWHSLERYVPKSEADGYVREMNRARAKFLRKYPIKDFLESPAGQRLQKRNPDTYDDLKSYIGKKINPTDFPWRDFMSYAMHQGKDIGYRLTSKHEWFAEKMRDLTLREQGVGGPWAEISRKFMSMVVRGWGKIFGRAESERLFKKFWSGEFADSRLNEFGLHVEDLQDVTGKGPVDVPEELFGGNHNLNDVLNPKSDSTISAAIVPEELGKMHLPSYLELQRVQKHFVDIMKKRYEEAINVEPDIAKLNSHIDKLTERLASAGDPEVIDKINDQITKAKNLLAIKQEIGASVPDKMPNFGYGVFKKGLSGAANLHDAIDHYYNNMFFKRLALATGGWAMRTGMSEASLNIFRQGPLNYTAGRLAASVARHERAVLHIGKKFTRQAAEDIAARIYHLAKEDGLIGPNGAVFNSAEEANAAVATVRRIANEANYYFKISNDQIRKAIQAEEVDMTHALTASKVSAAYRGFMVGAKSQILKQLNKQDLLDAAIRLMYLNDGHIVSPMLNATHAGIANDMQVGSSTDNAISAAVMKNPFITGNKKLQQAKFSRDYQSIDPGASRFPEALQTRSDWMIGSKIYAPTFAVYFDEYSKAKETLLAAGASATEASSKAAEIAAQNIRPKVKQFLDERMTDGEKKAMLRTTHPLSEKNSIFASRINPEYSGLSDAEHAALSDEEHAAIDHVTAVIKAAEGHVRLTDGSINEALLHGMAHNEIPADLGDFKKQMMSVDGKPIDLGMFNSTVGPEKDFADYNLLEKVLEHTAGKLSNTLHKKALGPIVNRLTRDPIYIIDFAAERKLLNSKVLAGDMTRDEADVIAQARASVNAMRYIHNPKNKLKFENMMRLWAPFYFAENQAWRRLGRLAWTNPGAAEQYTKAMYQTQQAIYNYDQNSGNIGIPVPGSSWLNKHFLGVPVSFELSPNSLRTVFPWSAEAGQAPGIGSLMDSFAPKMGPILSIPANLYLQKNAGMLPGADEFLSKYVVGQAGLGQPMALSFFPNSIVANIVKMTVGYFAARDQNELSQNVLGAMSSSYLSANMMVMTALLDAKQQEAWNRHKNDALPSDWAAAGATQHEWALFQMENDIEQQFKNPEDRQAFLDSANFKTGEIFALKTAFGAVSPMSTMLGRANLQYSTEFRKYVDETGSILQGANKFLAKHPDLTAETLFTTKATPDEALGVAWPTTPGTSKFMLEHKADIMQYGAAMRFALEEGPQVAGKSGYDQMAHFLQTSWSLRAQKTPKGFLNSYLESVFNQMHYGVLQPWGKELQKQGYSVNEVNNMLLHNKTTWSSRKNDPSKWSLLEQFGKNVAPLAFNNYLTGQADINRSAALQQLREVTSMPDMLAKYPNFRDIKEILLPAADQLIAYQAEASKTSDTAWRDNLAVQWNSELDKLAAAKPNLLPVIQQVFRPLAPIFTN